MDNLDSIRASYYENSRETEPEEKEILTSDLEEVINGKNC
ncbi:MAG: hypothetical protein DDT19_01259 [Syntrophomonadaceae bacterium]|nr:hypothetical protein [Bacillota bacterium]